MAGKSKFSLEAIVNLIDGITGPVEGIQKKMSGFSRFMKRDFGAIGKGILSLDKQINKFAIGLGAAAAGAATALGAIVQTTATVGDQFAKNSRVIGMTAESLQALTYAADMQGVSSEMLIGSLEKMNKNMGELKAGTGTLASYLKNTDNAFLRQLQSATSNEEAFALLAEKLNALPDEFSRSALAQAAFGRSGIELLKLTEAGADGIKALTDEARRYGLISNEAAETSEAFLDEQTRFKTIVLGLKNAIGSALLPKLTELLTAGRKLFEGASGGIPIIEQLKAHIDRIDVGKVVEQIKRFGSEVLEFGRKAFQLLKFLAPLTPWVLGFAAAIKVLAFSINAFRTTQTVLKGVNASLDGLLKMAQSKSLGKASIIAVILLIIEALTVLYFKSEKFRAFVNKFWPLIVAGVGVILTIIAAVKTWTGVQSVLNMTMLASPITWIILGIVALIAVIILVVTHWKEIVAWVKKAWSAFTDFASGIVDAVIPVLVALGQTIMKAILTPINLVIGGFIALAELLAKLPGNAGASFRKIADSAKSFQDKMNTTLTGTAGAFDYGGIWSGVGGSETPSAPNAYAAPGTAVAESRTYAEARTVHDFTLTAPSGWSIRRPDGQSGPQFTSNLGLQTASGGAH